MESAEISKSIYYQLKFEINKIIQEVSSTSQDKEIEETNKLAKKSLEKLNQNIINQLSILEKNAEWNTYTIAFYGETNAGKSTIIETLRILLGEHTKQEQQGKYKKWLKLTGISNESFIHLQQIISNTKDILKQQEISFEKLSSDSVQSLKVQENDLCEKKKQWDSAAKSANFLKRMLWIFHKSPELINYNKTLNNFEKFKAESKNAIQDASLLMKTTKQSLTAHEASMKKMEEQLKEGELLADGSIIGDGRADFTLETQNYTFEQNGYQFNLLDVPGIEGKEDNVSNAIWNSVHKAHTVLYVTSAPSSPQKGDGKNCGTLDKIQQHLCDQSEVWAIYNKRIINPKALKDDELISEDEQMSLKGLDNTMKEYLGDSYNGHLSVSAYPAFLAASSCLLPNSRDKRNLDKFLKQFSRSKLLERSNINSIINMLSVDTVEAFKNKIIISNKNKAKKVVIKSLDEINVLLKDFSDLLIKLEREFNYSSNEMDENKKYLESKMNIEYNNAIRNIIKDIREEAYGCIEKNISNKELEIELREKLNLERDELNEKINKKIIECINNFEERIKSNISRFEKNTSEIRKNYSPIDNKKINIKIKNNINSGINKMGVLGVLTSMGLLLVSNPAGWVVIALSSVTLAFQFYKSIHSAFNSDYKMSQQRKIVDENLDKLKSEIDKNIGKIFNSILSEVSVNIKNIKEVMSKSIQDIQNVKSKLLLSKEQINCLLKKQEF